MSSTISQQPASPDLPGLDSALNPDVAKTEERPTKEVSHLSPEHRLPVAPSPDVLGQFTPKSHAVAKGAQDFSATLPPGPESKEPVSVVKTSAPTHQYEAIHKALQDHDVHAIKAFALDGSLAKWEDKETNQTALHLLCARSDSATLVDIAIKHGCNVNVKDKEANTALQVAAAFAHGGDQALRLLVMHHADTSTLSIGLQRKLIRHAVSKGDVVAFNLLAKGNIGMNCPYDDGKTVLHLVLSTLPIKRAMLSITLLHKVDLSAKDHAGKTPLYLAAEQNNRRAFLQLIKAGANPKNETAEAMLFIEIFAAKQNCLSAVTSDHSQDKKNMLLQRAYDIGDLACMRALVKQGAIFQTEARDANDQTLLLQAINRNPIDHKTVDKLLLLRANVHVVDAQKHPLLELAVLKNDASLCQKLLNAGAKFGDNDHGRALVTIAFEQKNSALLSILIVDQKVKLAGDPHSNEYLLYACQEGHLDLVASCIRAGADPTCTNLQRQTVAHMAIERSDYEMLTALFQEKLLTNAQKMALLTAENESGEMPFHVACRESSLEMAEFLIDQTLKLDSSAEVKRDLLEIASDSHQPEIAKCVVKKGATLHPSYLIDEMNASPYNGEKIELFIQLGADVMAKNAAGKSLLQLAREAEDSTLYLSLITNPKFRPTEQEIRLGMQLAVKDKKLDVLKDLVKMFPGHQTVKDEKTGQGLVHLAAQTDSAELLQYLVHDLGLLEQGKQPDNMGNTPLHLAYQHEEVFLFLLTVNPPVNALNQANKTALSLAVANKDTLSSIVFERLIAAGAKFDVTEGDQILPHAIIDRNHLLVHSLLFNGCGKTLSDDQKGKCLLLAARSGDVALAKEFIDARGAPVNYIDKSSGDSFIHAVAAGGKTELFIYLTSFEGVNGRNKNKETALMLACQAGHIGMAKFLIEKKAKINDRSSQDKTALHYAAENGFGSLIRLLVAAKASVNAQDSKGRTALHYAAVSTADSKEAITELRHASANADLEDKEHKTALQCAVKKGNFDRVSLLTGKETALLTAVNESNFSAVCQDFDQYKNEQAPAKVSFSTFLSQRGFDCRLEGVNFSQVAGLSPGLFQDVDFTNIQFKACVLEAFNFSRANFTQCRFEKCTLQDCIFAKSVLKSVTVIDSNMSDCLFEKAQFIDVLLDRTSLPYTSLSEVTCNQVVISHSTLHGTSFFKAKFDEQCRIDDCNLDNCLLFEAQERFNNRFQDGKVTRPVIAVSWNTQHPGSYATKAVHSFKAADALPVKFNHFPDDVRPIALNLEVKKLLDEIKALENRDMHIPQKLLDLALQSPDSYPEVNKLMRRAQEQVAEVDAILLPGGNDIEPEFYGHPRSDEVELDDDYRRTIFEFATVKYARERGVPLMGICRGSQIGNVFYGGTLHQHVEGHRGTFETLSKKEPATKGVGMIRAAAYGKEQDKEMTGESVHHQAVRSAGDNLELVIEHRGIAKALEGESGSPLLLVQFHPESFDPTAERSESKVLGQNYELVVAFTKAAGHYHQKKEIFKKR